MLCGVFVDIQLQTEDMDDRPATPTPDPVTIATQEAEQTAIGVDIAAEVPKQGEGLKTKYSYI